MGLFSDIYNRLHPAPTTTAVETKSTQNEAEKAVKAAEHRYAEIVENQTQVVEVVTKLRVQRERNHFGELIEKTMRGVG